MTADTMPHDARSPQANIAIRIAVVMLLALLAVPLNAYAIDVDPGDYETPVPGHPIFLFYAQHVERSRLYNNGNLAVANAQLTSDVAMLRYVYPIQTRAGVVLPQFILPFGRLRADGNLDGLGSANGIGDLILAAPVWPITNREKRIHLGICPYLFVPIGEYDKNHGLNLGENRWKTALQVGAVFGLGKWFSVDLTADAMFHGKNKEAGFSDQTLEQNTKYQFQETINYLYNDTTRFAVGLSQATGGETKIDGVAQDDKTTSTKFLLTVSTFFDPSNQILFSYGQDLSVQNGLKEDARINFRLMHVF